MVKKGHKKKIECFDQAPVSCRQEYWSLPTYMLSNLLSFLLFHPPFSFPDASLFLTYDLSPRHSLTFLHSPPEMSVIIMFIFFSLLISYKAQVIPLQSCTRTFFMTHHLVLEKFWYPLLSLLFVFLLGLCLCVFSLSLTLLLFPLTWKPSSSDDLNELYPLKFHMPPQSWLFCLA